MNQTTIVALIIFVITYICIFAFEKLRPYIALGSAVIFIVLGYIGVLPDFSYDIKSALAEVDWNVLLMIGGTMGTVELFSNSRMPMLMSDKLVSKVGSVKWLIIVLSLFAGIVSAFVDNVATVLMIAPVAVAVCRKLKISPVPAIICISISSNLQGAATLVGDTTSILLAKAAKLDFMDFFVLDGKAGMFFVTEAGALASAVIIYLMFRKNKDKVDMKGDTVVKDFVPTYLLAGTVILLIATSFIPYKDSAAPGQFYKPEISNGLICVTLFLIGLVRQCIIDKGYTIAKNTINSIDYYTIGLLTGLFIIIGGIKRAGIIDLLADTIFKFCGGESLSKSSMFVAYSVIVWMSVIISAFIDNIPYVATMLPVINVLTTSFMASTEFAFSPYVLYFGLLVGATLGGNLTPVGASANITGIGILRKEGSNVSSKEFMSYSIPFTLTAVITGYVLVWLIYMPGFFK